MTIFKSSRAVPASLLAAGLALAGCGDGGGGASPQGPGDQPAAVVPLPTRVQNEVDKAKMSETTATAAPNTITDEVLMFSPADVMGDSSKSRERAGIILKARDDVAAELAKAEAALAALKKLKDEAGEEQLKLRIDAEITLVEKRIEAIKAIQAKGGKLADAVMKVTGSGDEPKDADDRAAEVAKAVEDAATFSFGITSGNSAVFPKQTGGKTPTDSIATTYQAYSLQLSALSGTDSTEFDYKDLRLLARVPTKGLVLKHDAPSDTKSFKEIFGDDKVVQRTTSLDSANPIQLASFEGMDAQDDDPTRDPRTSTGPNAGSLGNYNYKGIDGLILCQGVPRCSVSNGKLGAGWYWAAPRNRRYARWKMEGEKYVHYPDYAKYGYWLVMPTEGDEAGTINRVVTFGIPAATAGTAGSLAAASTVSGLSDNDKATYTGEAIGISVMTDDKNNAMDSGEFTADVTLEARFGSAPTVEGTVDNFVGNAVDTGWEVTLEEITLRKTTPVLSHFGLTTAEGDYQPDDVGDTEAQGRWHARAYGGSTTTRPIGITGDFHALFTNGRALGGYATRIQKDED